MAKVKVSGLKFAVSTRLFAIVNLMARGEPVFALSDKPLADQPEKAHPFAGVAVREYFLAHSTIWLCLRTGETVPWPMVEMTMLTFVP